jgi:tetratricopeptide (TPR) repeat protein
MPPATTPRPPQRSGRCRRPTGWRWRQIFIAGLAMFNSAHYAAAQKAFNFVEGRLPLPEVINDEAVAMSRQGKDGVVLFRRASVADPSDEDYHYNLAIALFRAGSHRPGAEARLRPRSSSNPPTMRQSSCKSSSSSCRPARGSIPTRPAASAPWSASAATTRRPASARRRSSWTSSAPPAWRCCHPDQRATQYCRFGRDYLAQGLLPEAESQFQSALEADPNSAEAHAGLAQVREYSGDPQQARTEAAASLKLHSNVAAWMVLARLDLAANQLPASADDVAHALLMEPTNFAALAMREALKQRGQPLP